MLCVRSLIAHVSVSVYELVITKEEKMAAHSGGVDWASVIKPILSTNYGPLSKADLTNLTKTILKW